MAGELDKNLSEESRRALYGNVMLHMPWHCKADPRFHYWVYIPETYLEEHGDQPYHLIVIIHGTGCHLDGYLNAVRGFANREHAAVLAPVFPGGLLVAGDINSYKLVACDGIRYDQILLSMVREMGEQYPGIRTDKFFLFGHSGGGQFVNRFLLAHPDKLIAASIGAPGRPTYLNFEEDYFWGVRDFKAHFDKEIDLEALKKVPVQMLVGEQDVAYIGDSPYGDNRTARLEALKENFEAHGVPVELKVIPGIGHDDGDGERIEACTGFFRRFF